VIVCDRPGRWPRWSTNTVWSAPAAPGAIIAPTPTATAALNDANNRDDEKESE